MSSSSSSDNEYDEDWYCEKKYNKTYRDAYGRNPFYPTMGHPFIYYAQVPQPIRKKERGREGRRTNPNFFVKAFRWYTQEHVPNRNVQSTTRPDMVGFATWLDTKYEEFLQESQIDTAMYSIQVKQTSVIETNRIHNNDCCEPCATKRFRVKSPWKKRRRAKSHDTGDEKQRSNQSFQYIMQPQDTSRPASECCHPSNRTVTSEILKKTVVKSRSFSSIAPTTSKECTETTELPKGKTESNCENSGCNAEEKEIKEIGRDVCCQHYEHKCMIDVGTQYDIPAVAVTSTRQSAVNTCTCEMFDKTAQKSIHKLANINIPKASKPQVNNFCQCPEEKVVFSDSFTQYDLNMNNLATVDDATCKCGFKNPIQNESPPVPSTSKVNKLCPCEIVVEEKLRQKRVLVNFSNNTVQTSNHSICLEKETALEYPLFMKIVCADKLNEDK